MKKYFLRFTVGFLCYLLILPSILYEADSTAKVNDELNVDFIYPYSNVSFGKSIYVSEAQANTRISTNHITVGLSLHQWPQQGLNCQHVGRSSYSTAENPGIEKWRYPAADWCDGSPVIDSDGTIYFGSLYLYAVYPNGTMKWKFVEKHGFTDYGNHPGIATDGTIYAATKFGSYLYSVNPDGTEKWSCATPEIDTSITIADDGIVYYGHKKGLDARYPNGTLKWTFPCGGVQSTPAVDSTGITYFGGIDSFTIYALYPDGTVKWNYTTDAWVHGSPTIAQDGTIYCGSDDDYLYAFFPNGTLKWKTYTGSGMRSSPSLDKVGNLYFGMWHSKIMSVAPNGTIRWTFSLPESNRIWGSTAAISDDGTIYIGSSIDMDMNGGGEIIALGLNGTLKWRRTLSDLCLHSSPVISADGSVYICASDSGSPEAWGYLHAFGTIENNQPPEAPSIDGPAQAQVRTNVKYLFQAHDLDNTPISFFIDWGDGTTRQTIDYEPDLQVPLYHTWTKRGTYTIRAKAIDTFRLESNWTTLAVKMPLSNDIPHFRFMEWLLERFPHAFTILRYLFEK